GDVFAVRAELRQPEAVQVRLVPDDEVPEPGNGAREGGGVAREARLLAVGERGRPAAEVVDGDEHLQPVERRGLGQVPELEKLLRARLRALRVPDRRDPDGVEPGE